MNLCSFEWKILNKQCAFTTTSGEIGNFDIPQCTTTQADVSPKDNNDEQQITGIVFELTQFERCVNRIMADGEQWLTFHRGVIATNELVYISHKYKF